jgi:hypothetical protein
MVLLLMMSACAGPRAAVQKGRPAPEGVRGHLLDSLRDRNQALRSLRGLADVRFSRSVFGLRGEAALVVEGPDHLRAESLTDFGVAQSMLTVDGRAVTILWPTENRYFEGPATPETLARYAGIGLEPETIVEILLGELPLTGKEPDVFVTGGGYLLKGDGFEALIDEREGAYVPRQYTVLSGAGRPVYQVVFDGYSKEGRPLWFADRMKARLWKEGFSRTNGRVEIDYRDLEINPKIDAKVFHLKVSEDAQRVSN